ncbi:MAG: hypothetical protein F6J86_47020, partial [Symploca sp. SIO1B1]|nr:hypothetical protein [Symploca sp. SIO1B1]
TSGFRFQFAEPLKFFLFSVLMLSPVNCWAIFQVLKRRQKVEVISSPVEYLHFGEKKAEGRRQKAEGKEEGCKLEGSDQCLAGNDISTNEEIFTTTNQNQFLPVSVSPRPPVSVYQTVALWVFAISTITLTAISLVYTALYYWNILAYLLLFPLLPTLFIKNQQGAGNASPLRRKSLLLTGQIYGLLFAALLVVNYSILPLASLGSKDADPESRMLFGWKDVAAAVRQEAAQLGNEPLLITTDYRSASALAYQLQNPHVIAIADRIDQFDFWYNEGDFSSKDALILADDWHPITPELLSRFQQTSAPITVPVTRFGVWIKDYYVVLGVIAKGRGQE